MEHNTLRTHSRRRSRAARPWLMTGIASILLLGCGDNAEPPVAPLADTQLLWSLDVNYPAVLLSTHPPHNTVTLQGIPRNVFGDVLDAPVTWSLIDSSATVTPEGVVTARYRTNNTLTVNATVTHRGVTRKARARIMITDNPTPPTLTQFSMQYPVPSDAFLYPRGCAGSSPCTADKPTPLVQRDGGGVAVPSLLVAYESSDSTLASINPTTGVMRGFKPGTVWMRASAYAYGVAKKDSVRMKILDITTHGEIGTVMRSTGEFVAMSSPTYTIATGGMISFTYNRKLGYPAIDVIFTDSAAAVASIGMNRFKWPGCKEILIGFCAGYHDDGTVDYTGRRVLTFTRPGTYVYRIPAWNNYEGKVIVKDPVVTP